MPLLTHPMLDQLGQLGLSGMADAFAELEASDETAALTHADWLSLLLDRELTHRGAIVSEQQGFTVSLRNQANPVQL